MRYFPPRLLSVNRVYRVQHKLIWWEVLFEVQDGKCDCCGHRFTGQPDLGYLDHHHDTGSTRGVICSACNAVVGRLEGDRPLKPGPRVILAEAYLAKYLPQIKRRIENWLLQQ